MLNKFTWAKYFFSIFFVSEKHIFVTNTSKKNQPQNIQRCFIEFVDNFNRMYDFYNSDIILYFY